MPSLSLVRQSRMFAAVRCQSGRRGARALPARARQCSLPGHASPPVHWRTRHRRSARLSYRWRPGWPGRVGVHRRHGRASGDRDDAGLGQHSSRHGSRFGAASARCDRRTAGAVGSVARGGPGACDGGVAGDRPPRRGDAEWRARWRHGEDWRTMKKAASPGRRHERAVTSRASLHDEHLLDVHLAIDDEAVQVDAGRHFSRVDIAAIPIRGVRTAGQL